ncbi:AI-2E family transporter [Corynebacterium kroppenstedtii]|uniref:AI-2E family transporter n=1 Tax=Corynebacterium sp. PCR 32 TaxID=3351342 RepID=UPI003094BA36
MALFTRRKKHGDRAEHADAEHQVEHRPVVNPSDAPHDRLAVIGDMVSVSAAWSIRLVLLIAGGIVGWRAIGLLWRGVLPILIALIICTLLWVPTSWMRKAHCPRWLAALVSVLGALAVIVGLFSLVAPSAVDQSSQLADQSIKGLEKVHNYVQGPPFNLNDQQINNYLAEGISKIQSSSDKIITGVVTGVNKASDLAVMLGIVLMITFFFLKDGDRFLPWLGKISGTRGEGHIVELLQRSWTTLGGFIRAQAVVSLIDAFFIGLGLVILKVPLALPLAIMTFMGGFIPIVGAIVAGAVAVLIALVSNGLTTALIVLAIILAVQQLEGNVLSPMLQSKAMNLHPVIVLLSVTVGSDLYGIIGAFLAVPVIATIAVWLRYFSELIDNDVTDRKKELSNHHHSGPVHQDHEMKPTTPATGLSTNK